MTDLQDAHHLLYGGPAEQMGEFGFVPAEGVWEWSATVAAMYGYAPTPMAVSTKTVLSHEHPDDRAAVTQAIGGFDDNVGPFAGRHRIIDTQGHTRHVLVIGDANTDDTGAVVGFRGKYVDLTATRGDAVNAELDTRVAGFAEARAVIEQAKGILMFVYYLTADQAFDLLSWRSQQSNAKVRDLATSGVDRVSREVDLIDANRARVDHILMHPHMPPTPR